MAPAAKEHHGAIGAHYLQNFSIDAPIQRVVKKTDDGLFYSASDPTKKLFKTRAEAQLHEKSLIADAMGAARRSERSTKFQGSTAKQQITTSSGIKENPLVNYPPRAAASMNDKKTANALQTQYARAPMGQPMREQSLLVAKEKQASDRTAEEKKMLKAPKQNMVDAKISMNHKLADSSIAAIIYQLHNNLFQAKLSQAQKTALESFIKSLSEQHAKEIFDALIKVSKEADKKKAAPQLAYIINALSMSPKNVRFGNATTNTAILYAYDPNKTKDGYETDGSARIKASTRGLARAKLIPAGMAAAATEQATSKVTGAALSSSTTGAKKK